MHNNESLFHISYSSFFKLDSLLNLSISVNQAMKYSVENE